MRVQQPALQELWLLAEWGIFPELFRKCCFNDRKGPIEWLAL